MLYFCQFCGNLQFAEDIGGQIGSACNLCPLTHKIKKIKSTRTYLKLKEIDDVLGGEEAWRNVDSTEERCPKCSHPRAYFMQIQIRSADEPMTTFYKCCNSECSHNWRE